MISPTLEVIFLLSQLRDSEFFEDQIANLENFSFDSGVIIFGHLLLVADSSDQSLFPYRVKKVEVGPKLSLIILLVIVLSLEHRESDVQRNDGFYAKGEPKWHFSVGVFEVVQ